MDAVQLEVSAKAKERQREWYGAPLSEIFGALRQELGLNQAQLASVIGVSAPMLSQLISGQRAKIGNPAVVQRTRSLQRLATEVAQGIVSADEVGERMHVIRNDKGSSVLSRPASDGASSVTVRRAVREVQGLLRTLASAGELLEAAQILEPTHPEVAEFLTVYGACRTSEAIAHYGTHQLS
ncbi:helix-turn-helix domain-containing protein [Streptomyces sp. T-3]|nr:helix-turn-helix domain-containing protein [Streptomyces sp. T-3]